MTYITLHTAHLVLTVNEVTFSRTNEYLNQYAHLNSLFYHPR